MTSIMSAIKVANLSLPILKVFAKRLGFDAKTIDENIQLFTSLLQDIQFSGKYNTVGDILADEEMMTFLTTLIAQSTDDVSSSNEDCISLHVDSTLTCPKCGHVSTFRTLQHLNSK